ncbi:hypothetical protein CVT26_015495 [Gymnopilus dilepis]|uniref:CxC2-like cysteine cluster KDZ transposase-associated domain-containing protein n=1 Tax=Gymnopilus dilepis TaxID=231916 RepID=A0A409WXC0_9AGAR|nr:hypothetical protein CVT26_015495 [Gymnopilus dilepis]
MLKKHKSSTKQSRNSIARYTISYDSPTHSGPRNERQIIRVREESHSSKTGEIIRSERTIVDENPWLPADDVEIGLDQDTNKCDQMLDTTFEDIEKASEAQLALKIEKKKKKKKSLASARPMILWKQLFRDLYLNELLRWEGRGDAWSSGETFCSDCRARKVENAQVGIFRCRDCFVPHLTCKGCCLRRHRMLPFHNIEQWNGVMFVKTCLKDLGLRVQLNHLGMTCPNPEPCHSTSASAAI